MPKYILDNTTFDIPEEDVNRFLSDTNGLAQLIEEGSQRTDSSAYAAISQSGGAERPYPNAGEASGEPEKREAAVGMQALRPRYGSGRSHSKEGEEAQEAYSIPGFMQTGFSDGSVGQVAKMGLPAFEDSRYDLSKKYSLEGKDVLDTGRNSFADPRTMQKVRDIQHSAPFQEQRIGKSLSELRGQVNEGRKRQNELAYGIRPGVVPEGFDNDADNNYAAAAMNILRAQTTMKSDKKGEDSVGGFFGNLGRGIRNALPSMATGGVSDIILAETQKRVLDKLTKANGFERPEEHLSESELLLFRSMEEKLAADIVRGGNKAWSATVGDISAQALPFIEEMMITGGFTGAAKEAATRGLMRSVAKRLGTNIGAKVAANAGKVGLNAVEAGARAVISPSTYAKTLEALYSVQPEQEAFGGGIGIVGAEKSGLASAYRDAWLDNSIEIFTEMGGAFAGLSRMITQNPVAKKAMSSALGRPLKNVGDFFDKSAGGKVAKGTFYNGVVGETLEELEGALYRGEGKDFFKADNLLPMAVAFAIPGVVFSGVSGVDYGVSKRNYERSEAAMNAELAGLGFDEQQAAQAKDMILSSPVELTGRVIGELSAEIAGDEQQAEQLENAAFEWAANYAKFAMFDKAMGKDLLAKRYEYQKMMREQEERAGAVIQSNLNPVMDAVVEAEIDGVPRMVTGGNIVRNEEGGVDYERSDSEIYYNDENGKRQVASIKMVGKVLATLPAEEALRQAEEIAKAPVVAQQENDEVRPYEAGESVRFTLPGSPAPLYGEIVGVDEAGGYEVLVDGFAQPVRVEPRQIVDDDHIAGLQNEDIVEYRKDGKVLRGTVEDAFNYRDQGMMMIDGVAVPVEDIVGKAKEEAAGELDSLSDEQLSEYLSNMNNAIESGAVEESVLDRIFEEREKVVAEIQKRELTKSKENEDSSGAQTNQMTVNAPVNAGSEAQQADSSEKFVPRQFKVDKGLNAIENQDGTYSLDKVFAESELGKAEKMIGKLNKDYLRNGLVFELRELPREDAGNPFEKPAWGIVARKADKGVEQADKANQTRLTEQQAAQLIDAMEQNAEAAPVLELTPENWYAEFGEDGIVETPVGEVKMGENQYLKLQAKDRGTQFGMVKPTLTNPDVVVEETSREDSAINDRETNLLFIKTFTDNQGGKYTHFESVTVSRDKKEVVVSNHMIRKQQLLTKLKAGRVVYQSTALDASGETSAEYAPQAESGAPSGKNPDRGTISRPTQPLETGVPVQMTNTSPRPKDQDSGNKDTKKSGRKKEKGRKYHIIDRKSPNSEALSVFDYEILSLRDKILYSIAAGQRFVWDDVKGENGDVISYGLGSSLFGRKTEGDRRGYFNILSSSEKGGATPEQFAHRLWEELDGAVSDQDILNELLDVLQNNHSNKIALESLTADMTEKDPYADMTAKEAAEMAEAEKRPEAPLSELQQRVADEQTAAYDKRVESARSAWKSAVSERDREAKKFNQANDIFREETEEQNVFGAEGMTDVSTDNMRRINEKHNPVIDAAKAKFDQLVSGREAAIENIVQTARNQNEIEYSEDAGEQEIVDSENEWTERDESVPFQIENGLEEANERFNEELGTLTAENADSRVFNLGYPSDIALSIGIENKPYKLYGNKLIAKMKKHGFNASDVRDLPKALFSPIAIFKGNTPKSFAILTELNINGNNVLATVSVGKDKDIDFNIISSTYGKSGSGIIGWINKGRLLYADKEKTLNYLGAPAPIAGSANNPGLSESTPEQLGMEAPKASTQAEELDSATKVIQNFENPKLSGGKSRGSGERMRTIPAKAWKKLIERLEKTGLARDVIADEAAYQKELDSQKQKQKLTNKSGTVYGFVTPDGVVYLDPSKMNANTPIHEFGHLFWPVMPAEMKAKITELLKQTPGWERLSNNPAYANLKTDEQKADELFNTLLGDYGEYSPRVREIVGDDIGLIARVQRFLNDFLEWLRATVFNDTDAKLNVFAKKTLGELLGGKSIESSRNLKNPEEGDVRQQFIGEQGAENRAENLENKKRSDNFVENKSASNDKRTATNSERPALVGRPETRRGIYQTVEASNLAGSISTVREIEEREELESRGINPDWDRVIFRRELEKQAEQNGVLLDRSYLDDKELKHDHQIAATTENDIYINPDGKTITKVNNLSQVKGADHKRNLKAFMDRLEAHNVLFPEVAYDIKGFIKNKRGFMSLAMEQPYIDAERNATQEEIDKYLSDRGFWLEGGNLKHWTNGKYTIEDARPANVLKGKDGRLYFIDTIPHSVEYMTNERGADISEENKRDEVRFQIIDQAIDKAASNDTESTPPAIKEGESIFDYATRVSEWWKEKSKEVNSVAKELNKANADVAELRAKRNRLIATHSERVEKIRENAKEVKNYIQGHLSRAMIAWMGEREFGSLLEKIENATRRKDLEPVFRAIDRTINTIEYRKYHAILENLLNKKITGKDKRGVSVAKNIGGATKELVEYIRAYIQENKGKGEEEIDARIKDIYNEYIKSNVNNAGEAEMTQEQLFELQSLEVLRDHSLIHMLQDNMAEIDNEIKNIYNEKHEDYIEDKDNRLKRKVALEKERNGAQRELVEATKNAAKTLGDIFAFGRAELSGFIKEQKDRKLHVNRIANAAVANGKDWSLVKQKEERESKAKWLLDGLNRVKDFMFGTLNNFNTMLKLVDTNNLMGEGRLYDYFMLDTTGVMTAGQNYRDGIRSSKEELQEAAKRITGKSFSDLFYESTKKAEEVSLEYMDKKGVKRNIKMSYGELLYLYSVGKMADGRIKLDRMGIDEVAREKMAERIPQNLRDFMDWVQSDFLPKRREKYNETHKTMFGTSMAKIEGYFPLRYDSKEVRGKDKDIAEEDIEKLPSSVTGAIINRVRNGNTLDLGANAFDALVGNINEMEEWSAYAQVRRDINTVCNNQFFKNSVEANMKGTFKIFKDAARVAVRSYKTKNEKLDQIAGQVNKLVAAGAIGFRLTTAVKQFLSYPAFMGYSANPVYQARLIQNAVPVMWVTNWQWAMKELPGFKDRWDSKNMGDEKLMERFSKTKLGKLSDTAIDWSMFPNRLIDAITVVAGSKSVYDYQFRKNKKAGMDEAEAKRRALISASVAYNETQQSALDEFLSPTQKSGSALARFVTTFQNANYSFMRKEVESVVENYRITFHNKALMDGTMRKYIKNGMSEEEAREKARKDLTKAFVNNLGRQAIFGFALGMIWRYGMDVVMGTLGDDDDEREKDLLVSMAIAPLDGTIIGPYLEAKANGYNYSISIAGQELERLVKDFKETADEEGLISWDALYATGNIGLRLGGVNLESLFNIYNGFAGMFEDKKVDANDVLTVLNYPKTGKRAYAAKIREGEGLIEYAGRIKKAYDNDKLFYRQVGQYINKYYFHDADGDMTEFDRVLKKAKRWEKLKRQDSKSEEYYELDQYKSDWTKLLRMEDSLSRLYRDGKALENKHIRERLGTVKGIIKRHEAGYMEE